MNSRGRSAALRSEAHNTRSSRSNRESVELIGVVQPPYRQNSTPSGSGLGGIFTPGGAPVGRHPGLFILVPPGTTPLSPKPNLWVETSLPRGREDSVLSRSGNKTTMPRPSGFNDREQKIEDRGSFCNLPSSILDPQSSLRSRHESLRLGCCQLLFDPGRLGLFALHLLQHASIVDRHDLHELRQHRFPIFQHAPSGPAFR
jgi:hypothetical protein